MGVNVVPTVTREQVVRLWLHRQGLSTPRGERRFTRSALTDHLERTGALQIDTINVVDRAHYLTLWSRFGAYKHRTLDRWVYDDGLAYEYWGHEASILPISHLPLGRRRMRDFPPESWSGKSWWSVYRTSPGSKRRVLRRLRHEGPLERIAFDAAEESKTPLGGSMPLPSEDKRSLKLLWHAGKVAVRSRTHFRCLYDLAERVYPDGPTASRADLEDSWLLTGLSGNGVASERHLRNYVTGPSLKGPDRKRVIARNLEKGRIVEVRVNGVRGTFYARPEDLDCVDDAPQPTGTTLICPFDSVLWQRQRAQELFGFEYRVEIYVPPAKRQFGYYVMPILHHGRLVGRLDPKLHRDSDRLEIKTIHLEEGFKRSRGFDRALADTLISLAEFAGADTLELPRGWRGLG